VLALVTARLSRSRVVWGVRSSNLESAPLDAFTRLYRRLGSFLSSHADLIIANSEAGREYATSIGYPAEKVITIPNGFETDRFVPDPQARSRARDAWGIVGDTPVVGLVARLDPIKDHPTFLRAAALLVQRIPEVKFVCVGGGGSAEYNQELRQLAGDLSLNGHVIWAGETADMPAAHNGLDVASLVSTSEGFANAVGEAMACAVPCVVTDVGDSAEIVGETGIVVRPGDPYALCEAWQTMLTHTPDERADLRLRARQRILDYYSVSLLAVRTSRALLSLVDDSQAQRTHTP
jgi:glycosyltransferase involved in cell wall biosynthesis